MHRNSVADVFRNHYSNSPGLQWKQPPHLRYTVPIEEQSDFLRANQEWYKKNHPDWLRKYNQYLENNAKILKPLNYQSKSERFPSNTSYEENKSKMRNSLSTFSKEEKLSNATQFKSLPTSYMNTDQAKNTLNQAKDIFITKFDGIQNYFKTQAKYQRGHSLKIAIATIIILFIELLCSLILVSFVCRLGGINWIFKSYTSHLQYITILAIIQSFGNLIIMKDEGLGINLIYLSVYSYLLVYFTYYLCDEIFVLQFSQVFVVVFSQLVTSIVSLVSLKRVKIPKLQKLGALNVKQYHNCFKVLNSQHYNIFDKLRIEIKKNYQNYCPIFFKNVTFLRYSVFISFFVKLNMRLIINSYFRQGSIKSIENLCFPFFISVILDCLLNSHIPNIRNKLTKYTLMVPLQKQENGLPMYIYPLVINDEERIAEFESLKFLYFNLEQPKKLILEDSGFPSKIKNGSKLSSIITAYQVVRIEEQIQLIYKISKEHEQLSKELMITSMIGFFSDITSFWKLIYLRNQVGSVLDEMERQLKLLTFLNEVFTRVLIYNTTKQSDADQINEANFLLKIHIDMLQATRQFKLRTRKVICRNLLQLCRIFNVPNRIQEIQGLMD